MLGLYDKLYKASGQLWGDTPGRMVTRAARHMAPGRCLDLGCGDGRNLVYLEQGGWVVDGVEVSEIALASTRRRLQKNAVRLRGSLIHADVSEFQGQREGYDLVLVYGLYHCLDDVQLTFAHQHAITALRSGGLLAFSALDDRLPVPCGHATDGVQLRPESWLLSLFDGWPVLAEETGLIEEEHEPTIGEHRHSAVWGLFQKP